MIPIIKQHYSSTRSRLEAVLGSGSKILTDKKTSAIADHEDKPDKAALWEALAEMSSKKERQLILKALQLVLEEDIDTSSDFLALAKARGIRWHRLGSWGFALKKAQISALAAMARRNAPGDWTKRQLVDYLANGNVPESADWSERNPNPLGETYAEFTDSNPFEGLVDKDSVGMAKASSRKKQQAKKRNRTRREKTSTKKTPKKSSKKQKTGRSSDTTSADSLEQAFDLIRSAIGETGGGANEDKVREIAREEAEAHLNSPEGKETVEQIVDERIDEKLNDGLKVDLSFA